jgi:hypothetical protein
VEPVLWLTLGATTFVAALRARRSRRALLVGRVALAGLFIVGGALVNAFSLLTGVDYAGFADAAYIPFVTDTWRSLVAPNQGIFIGLLVVFEAAAGALVLSGGRGTRVGIIAVMGFHVALLSFGWFFYVWSIPMLVALALLLRAEREHEARGELSRDDAPPAHAVPRPTQPA